MFSLAECGVAICNSISAEIVTFSNAGKVPFIMFGRLLFFPNTICDELKPL